MKCLALSLLLFVSAPALAGETTGLWVWDGREVLQSDQKALLAEVDKTGITDIYLSLAPRDYTELKSLPKFISSLTARGVVVWGLDGCRCYFDDADGPAGLYQNVDAMIAYNKDVPEAARFGGFQTDNEPHDLPDYPNSFHNGIANSKLTPQQATERQKLLISWLDIQQTVYAKLKDANLKTGAAMVFFTEDYYGEPLNVTYDGRTATAGKFMMAFTDDYVVMSYNTDPLNAAARVARQAEFASKLPVDIRPRVLAAMEVNPGVEENVSYGDTPGKQTRAVVLADKAKITEQLKTWPAFGGVAIHSWRGWKRMAQ